MHAVVVAEPGGPETMKLAEVPEPVPGPGEVVINVTAAGVNRADLLQRQGFYPPPPGASEILGLECSGTIASTGAAADLGLPAGVQVCALLAGGGYAQQVAVPAGQVMPLPEGVGLVDAGALPEVACTVYSNLAMKAGLQAGEWLLIHGGGSGIGTFAIQWAKAIGAKVIATAGSPGKVAGCLTLGADAAIDYREEDFVSRVKEITDGHGADVILDVVGAKYLDRNLHSLAISGRLVVIGLQGGTNAELDLGRLLSRRATVMGTSLRARPTAEKADICQQVVAEVWPLMAAGKIEPVVERALPLADAAVAHEELAASTHFGKFLLLPERNVAAGVPDLVPSGPAS
ncbi:MAG: NAD(P)H-quinone oxidoreductase [Actinomycetia bacterium]|nr:NAD(P)H-quinone oxidoreductase [Actinomycetes bacterium]MCH9801129.1 NAD(P)H-quinone oxidoreductase [Actinomycetes bacterium]